MSHTNFFYQFGIFCFALYKDLQEIALLGEWKLYYMRLTVDNEGKFLTCLVIFMVTYCRIFPYYPKRSI